MKKLIFPVAFTTLLLISGYCSNAQYGKEPDAGINSKTSPGNYYNPTAQTIFSVDTSVNHIDFGQKKNKGSFKTIFAFRQVADSKSVFTFKKSQITGTHMTKNSGIIGIELTTRGFEILYSTKNKLGPVDDYVAIHTENGDIILRLTGQIIDSKKKDE